MKKTAVLVVCVLLLCGGFCHLYLAAQVKEAENVDRPVPHLVTEVPLSPIMISTAGTLAAETPTTQPVPRPVTHSGVISVQTLQPALSSGTTLQPVRPVAVVPAKTTPDISKFRLPIEYKLKNIPVESLIEFLEEEFPQVVAQAMEETGAIMITASLADHRTIKDMLVEIEREVAALRSDAANVAEAAEQVAALEVLIEKLDQPKPGQTTAHPAFHAMFE